PQGGVKMQPTEIAPSHTPPNPRTTEASGGAIRTLNVEIPRRPLHLPTNAQGSASEDGMTSPISDGSLETIKEKVQFGILRGVAGWTATLFPVVAGIAVFMVWLFSLAPRSHVDQQNTKIEQKIQALSKEIKEQQSALKRELKEMLNEKFGLVWKNLGRVEERLDKLRDRVSASE